MKGCCGAIPSCSFFSWEGYVSFFACPFFLLFCSGIGTPFMVRPSQELKFFLPPGLNLLRVKLLFPAGIFLCPFLIAAFFFFSPLSCSQLSEMVLKTVHGWKVLFPDSLKLLFRFVVFDGLFVWLGPTISSPLPGW